MGIKTKCFMRVKFINLYILYLAILTSACSQSFQNNSFNIIPAGKTIQERFEIPREYKRIEYDSGSFSHYLQHLSLKPHNTPVYLYNGIKKVPSFHAAIIDMSVGDKDLQQCADAIMRLRAEYLYAQKRYDDICFHFTNGFKFEYSKWKKGYRIQVKGNSVHWVNKQSPDKGYETFLSYMQTVFIYSGTLSLSKELIKKNISDLKPGDVFIIGGSPGHAVIVVDHIRNISTGKKYFMIAQSFMPAQSIHILVNLNDKNLSPWYAQDFESYLLTPEWTFSRNNLMAFE